MLMAVRKNLSLIKSYFKMNLSSSMEYRTSFIIQVFGMFLNNASFAFFWWLLFDKVKDIGGYGFDDVMLLWALASSSFGLSFILFGNTRRLIDIIIKGELDSYLLQPKDVLINVIASKTDISAWGDLFYGYILFIVIRGVNLPELLLFTFFVITGGMIYTSVLVTVNSLAFYFGNIGSLSRLIFEFLITFSIYPESIFKGFVKAVLFTIIPAGFVTMIPVRIIQNFNLIWLLGVVGVAVIWLVIGYTVFYKGLKRYESGNLMVQKM